MPSTWDKRGPSVSRLVTKGPRAGTLITAFVFIAYIFNRKIRLTDTIFMLVFDCEGLIADRIRFSFGVSESKLSVVRDWYIKLAGLYPSSVIE